jgi:protein SCO1
MITRGRRWRAGALAAAVLVVASCGGEGGQGGLSSPTTLAGVVREAPLQVADVVLPEVGSSGGEPMAMRAPDGEVLLVYFGYTTCPDVCPMTMSDIRIAIEDLDADLAERVTVAMVTVDPDRDQPETLSGYLGSFFERTAALRTEDPDELATAARAFGVQYEVEPHEPGDTSYEVAHSAVTYVVDDRGTVLVEWPFGFAREHMTADLSTVLTQEETA